MSRHEYRSRLRIIVFFSSIVHLSACGADPGYSGRSSRDWIGQLRSPDPIVRRVAAEALGKVLQINPRERNAIEALSIAIRDTIDDVRMAAASSLTTDGVDAIAALSGFHNALHDSAHADVRSSMARLIGILGRERGRPLIPALSESVEDPDAGVRTATIESLGMLGPDPRIDVRRIAGRAADADPSVRRAVLQTLLNLRASPAVTVPIARSALRDSVSSVRVAAAYALWPLGPIAAPALPELRAALKDSISSVRAGAAFAIGSMGPVARAAILDLKLLLADPSVEVVTQASAAIASLQGKVAKRLSDPSS